MADIWFGKGCEYLTAQHEMDDEFNEYEPVLVFCNHPGNHDDVEGNCTGLLCPKLSETK